jgi:hypothetical protein
VKRLVPVVLWSMMIVSACAPASPDIALERAEVDLGNVPNGVVRTFKVELANRGQGDLVVEAVTTSCGCTTASIEPRVIPPGGTGDLIIHYDSGAHGSDFSGQVARQVFVDTNDPDEPEVEISFTAMVVAP